MYHCLIFIVIIFVFPDDSSAYEAYDFSSSKSTSIEKNIDRLKTYTTHGEKVIVDLKEILDDYELALKGFNKDSKCIAKSISGNNIILSFLCGSALNQIQSIGGIKRRANNLGQNVYEIKGNITYSRNFFNSIKSCSCNCGVNKSIDDEIDKYIAIKRKIERLSLE